LHGLHHPAPKSAIVGRPLLSELSNSEPVNGSAFFSGSGAGAGAVF